MISGFPFQHTTYLEPVRVSDYYCICWGFRELENTQDIIRKGFRVTWVLTHSGSQQWQCLARNHGHWGTEIIYTMCQQKVGFSGLEFRVDFVPSLPTSQPHWLWLARLKKLSDNDRAFAFVLVFLALTNLFKLAYDWFLYIDTNTPKSDYFE